MAAFLQSPDFTLKLLYTLVNRLNKCDREVESMLFHNILGRLADAIVVLQDGRVKAQGSVFDLLTDVDAIAGAPPFGAVFEATLAGQRTDGLSLLAFDGGSLTVTKLSRPLGARVRVRLRAEDIMLAREEPRAISANNVLPCSVSALRVHGDQADIQLRCGSTRLTARITSASRARLGLQPGVSVFAIVKSVTVEREAGA